MVDKTQLVTRAHSVTNLIFNLNTMSCALFNTHFVRDGNNNYAIVQSNDKVSFASYVVSERHSSSSIGTRTFSGRVEKPRALYQWNTSLIENTIAAETVVPEAATTPSSSSTEEVVSAPQAPSNVYNNALSFTFPVMKGCIYFIQITFGLGNETDLVEQRSIHMNVDPNKRRLVTTANKRVATASLSSKTDGSASSTALPVSSSNSGEPDYGIKTLSSAPSANKKPRRAAAGASSGKSSKIAATASTNADPALVM